jgi:predicted metal-dependent hydrolase
VQLSLPLSGQTATTRDVVVFVRHRRARRYILRVLRDGTVRVTLPRRGARRDATAFVEANAAWIERERARIREGATPPAEPADVALEAALRDRARRELPEQLLALAKQHNISVPRISVRNQRTRWGACSPSGTITLNWRLIQVPEFVRDYVLIHELMHRRELNHSRRFWRLVAASCPQLRDARRWLRQEGKMLWSDAD